MPRIVGYLYREGGYLSEGVLHLEWQINNFLSLPGTTGTFYNSSVFTFSNSCWYLRTYPYSEVGEKNYSDGIALYLLKTASEIYVSTKIEILSYSIGIKNSDGSSNWKKKFTWKFDMDQAYGHPNILKRSELQPSDSVTFICKLKKPFPPRELNTVCAGLENVLVAKKFCDVTIHVGQQVFETHKVILAAASTVFAAMFERDMLEKNSGTVNIVDCDPESFKDFLHFVYTGRIDITENNVIELYKTAHKYNVEELLSYCVAFILQNLSVKNICDFVALGELYSDVALKYFSTEFFDKNVGSILRNSKWKSFRIDNRLVADELRTNALAKRRKQRNVASKTKVKKKNCGLRNRSKK